MGTFPILRNDPSPQTRAPISLVGGSAHFGQDTIVTPTGTAGTIDLTAGINHQILDTSGLSGDATITLEPPTGPAGGTITVRQPGTKRNLTWQTTGRATQWLTAEPDFSADTTDRGVTFFTTGSTVYLLSSAPAVSQGLTHGRVADVTKFGATGQASEDDDAAAFLAAAQSLGSQGGTLYVPQGTYTLATAFDCPDKINIEGEGPGTIIRCGLNDWTIRGDGTGLGIISYLGNTTHARISNLRISGRESEWVGFTGKDKNLMPLAVYATGAPGSYNGNAEGVIVSDVWFEDWMYETLWNHVTGIVTGSYFRNCGRCNQVPQQGFTALPVMQFFDDYNLFVGNKLENCGMGINGGGFVTITGNVITGSKADAISSGDNAGGELCTIAGNTVIGESNTDKQFVGINVTGSNPDTPRKIMNIVGNTISTKGTDGHIDPVAIRIGSCDHAAVSTNAIFCKGTGVAIEIKPASVAVSHDLEGNRIDWESEVEFKSTGIQSTAADGQDVEVLDLGNTIRGLTIAQSNYAVRYQASGSGLMKAHSRSLRVTGGNMLWAYSASSNVLFAADELANRFINQDSPIPGLKADYRDIFETRLFNLATRPGVAQPGAPAPNEITIVDPLGGQRWLRCPVQPTGPSDTVNKIRDGFAGDRVTFWADAGKTVTFAHDGAGDQSADSIFTKDGTDRVCTDGGWNRLELEYNGMHWMEV